MPRPKIWGLAAVAVSLFCAVFFIYNVFYSGAVSSDSISSLKYYTIAAPVSMVAYSVIATGFWIGWTILSIKVVSPMPEIVEKKDYSKIKAFILSLCTLAAAALLAYGLYIKTYWAIAVPSAVIASVILGSIFWVGIAILNARSTLPEK